MGLPNLANIPANGGGISSAGAAAVGVNNSSPVVGGDGGGSGGDNSCDYNSNVVGRESIVDAGGDTDAGGAGEGEPGQPANVASCKVCRQE